MESRWSIVMAAMIAGGMNESENDVGAV